MKKILSIILVLAALFGLVASGISAKGTLDSMDHYKKAGEENDKLIAAMEDGLAQLEENEAAYLAGREQYEAGKAQYEAGKAAIEAGEQLVAGVETLNDGYETWKQGYDALSALGSQAGLDAPSAENVAEYDALIGQLGIDEAAGVPQAVADGKAQLAEGLSALLSGMMSNEDMAAAIQQSSGMSDDQIDQLITALPTLPYDQFDQIMSSFAPMATTLSEALAPQLEEGKKQLADAETQLADAEKQLGEFEAGRDQLIDGLNQVVANPADKGLTSIADRLDEGFTFVKENGDLDIEAGKKVVEAWKDYSADSGKAITKELVLRAVGAAAVAIASVLALLAGIFGLRGKGGKKLSFIAEILACVGFVVLLIGGNYWSKQAEACGVTLVTVAAAVLTVAAALVNILGGKKDDAE